LFLTDMEDLTADMLDGMVETEARQGRYVSFVGIGMGFNSELAEVVSKHRGSNYFCITRDEELKKVIVDHFAWNFFPAAFDVEVAHQSDAFELVAVYGTSYDTRDEVLQADWNPTTHKFYPNAFKEHAKVLLLCARRRFACSVPMPAVQRILGFLSSGVQRVIRVDTVFPSAVHGDGAVEGGLLLLQLRPRSGGTRAGTARLVLRYTADGVEYSRCHDVGILADMHWSSAAGEAAVSMELAVRKGVVLQRYVEVCRAYLAVAHKPAMENKGPADTCIALADLEALLSDFEAMSEGLEALCPGLLNDLRAFTALVHGHSRLVAGQSGGRAV